jgi:hypothetical protein
VAGEKSPPPRRKKDLTEVEKGKVMNSATDVEDVELNVEEMEEVIAPATLNHNETLVADAR